MEILCDSSHQMKRVLLAVQTAERIQWSGIHNATFNANPGSLPGPVGKSDQTGERRGGR